MSSRLLGVVLVCTALSGFATPGRAQPAHTRFDAGTDATADKRPVLPCPGPVETAVRELVAGLRAGEAQSGLSSRIPPGVEVVYLAASDNTVSVDLSPEILTGLDEATLRGIFDRFRFALLDFPRIRRIRLTCKGKLLSSYLEPVKAYYAKSASPDPRPITDGEGLSSTQGLGGTSITIGPSHGRVWHSSGGYWYWQRGEVCGAGEELMEGLLSIRLMQFLYQYLSQDGATVHVCRQLDESDCCHPAEDQPWWKMAARYWLEHNAIPSWVWDSSSSDINDDIRARPLYADYVGSDIYLSHHTNAFDGTASGTVTFRDTAMEHPEHEADSYQLALSVQDSVVSAIHSTYDGTWYDRGVHDSDGAFGEIRIPDRPACLIELAFHDNCTLDGVYLMDHFFRSLTQWAIYKGLCDYFGRTPTWAMYSCEYVSDTIPSQMDPDQNYAVSITFRNRGVLWSDVRDFHLRAVDDSDPFTSFNRVDISGEVGPGSTYAFTFTMTAPPTEGTYVTDWQMVRDGITWFGPTHSEEVHVGPPPVPGDFDDDDDVDQEDFGHLQACLTGSGGGPPTPECEDANLDRDTDVDQDDVGIFLGCLSGADAPGDVNCAAN